MYNYDENLIVATKNILHIQYLKLPAFMTNTQQEKINIKCMINNDRRCKIVRPCNRFVFNGSNFTSFIEPGQFVKIADMEIAKWTR